MGLFTFFLQLVLSVSLSVGSILAVANYVFGNYSLYALYFTVCVSRCHWGLPCATLLAYSLVPFSWFTLLVCSLDSVFWSSLCSHILCFRVSFLILSVSLQPLGPLSDSIILFASWHNHWRKEYSNKIQRDEILKSSRRKAYILLILYIKLFTNYDSVCTNRH